MLSSARANDADTNMIRLGRLQLPVYIVARGVIWLVVSVFTVAGFYFHFKNQQDQNLNRETVQLKEIEALKEEIKTLKLEQAQFIKQQRQLLADDETARHQQLDNIQDSLDLMQTWMRTNNANFKKLMDEYKRSRQGGTTYNENFHGELSP